ncbi:MAG: hypothetical protein ACPG4U_07520 [Pseudomonadales bacterium]
MDVNIGDVGAWKEVRARVDSLATGVFWIAGGALTISMYMFLTFKAQASPLLLSADNQFLAETAWYCLLGAILFFALLKAHLIVQCFHASALPQEQHCNNDKNNLIALLIGLIGLVFFLFGMVLLVKAAAMALYS